MDSNLTSGVILRSVNDADLPVFFEQQLDPQAIYMAAFTRKDSTDREAFLAHWTRCLSDDTIMVRTVLFNGQVAGSVASFVDDQLGEPEVTY